MNANDIQRLLAKRHSDDVFVPECKNGPTQTARHLRLDAWVMKKSWSKPLVTGYEIKVSRQDFLNDDKWHGYLDYCNELYFACPTGLIDPTELPDEVGLLYVTKTGNKLIKKKQAQRRSVDIPESIFRYILMARTRIDSEGRIEGRHSCMADYWRDWLNKKNDNREIGYLVSEKIRKIVNETNEENMMLKRKMATYDNIIQRLNELGFDSSQSITEWQFKNKMSELINEIPLYFNRDIKTAINHLSNVLEFVESKE